MCEISLKPLGIDTEVSSEEVRLIVPAEFMGDDMIAEMEPLKFVQKLHFTTNSKDIHSLFHILPKLFPEIIVLTIIDNCEFVHDFNRVKVAETIGFFRKLLVFNTNNHKFLEYFSQRMKRERVHSDFRTVELSVYLV